MNGVNRTMRNTLPGIMRRGGLENAIFPNGSERRAGGGEGEKKTDENVVRGIGRRYNECGDHSGGNVTIQRRLRKPDGTKGAGD